jgi:hypothetical protein
MNPVPLNYKLLHHDSLVWDVSSIIIATTKSQILDEEKMGCSGREQVSLDKP